jgi:MFS family permease
VTILAHRPFVKATVTSFFFFASLNGFLLLPLHIQALGGTEIEIGLVMGLYSAVGIVCQPLVGPWVDALGRRPFMIAGVALILASSLLAMLAASIPWLGVVRVLQGLGFSIFFVANFSHVIDLVPPERRGWALGIFGVAGLLSTALAPLIGEWIVRAFGFRTLFALCAALAAAAFAVVWGIREVHRDVGQPARGADWARAGVDELLRLHMAVTLFYGLGTGTLWAFLPTFAEDLGVRTLALFYTAYACSAMAVRIFGGRLIDSRGRRAVIVPSMFVQAGSVALLAVLGFLARHPVPALPSLFIAGLLSGGAHGFIYPGLAALATDQAPEARRASVVGVFSGVFLVGSAGGAFAFGYVAHAAGYPIMWAIATALLLVGAALSLRLSAEPEGNLAAA